MNNFKFLFPMGFAYNNSDNPAHSNARKNGNIVISSNKLVKAGQTFGNGDLGGTLCGISVDGVIEPGDHMQSGNSLTYYVPIVLGYLTQLFYLSSDTGQSQQYYPYNYVYLSDNYSIYGRDVVIELQPSENMDIPYEEFLITIYQMEKQYRPHLPEIIVVSTQNELSDSLHQ